MRVHPLVGVAGWGIGILLGLLIGIVIGSCNSQQHHKSDLRPVATPTPAPTPYLDSKGTTHGIPEVVYDGHIRSINWSERSFVYESGWGFIKPIGPICDDTALPVWQGMHVFEINFHWMQPSDSSGCFVLDFVGHRAGVPGE